MESARNHRASGQSSKLKRLFYGGPSIGVLHEDVVARIATIGEPRNGRGRQRRNSS